MDKPAKNQGEIPRKKVKDSKTSDFCVLVLALSFKSLHLNDVYLD